MRHCSHCRSWNVAWPVRCRYCGAGLDGRLCRRNHVNPTDSRLAFCGECGEPLAKVHGAGSAWRVYVLAAGVGFTGIVTAVLLGGVFTEPNVTSIAIVLLVLGLSLRFALQLLPPSGRSLVLLLLEGSAVAIVGAARLVGWMLLGTRYKGRR